jgi:hypothetical protein
MLENCKRSQYRTALLTMPNIFPTHECQFTGTFAEDLHLSVTWDECNKDDQNSSHGDSLVRWRGRYLVRKRYRR